MKRYATLIVVLAAVLFMSGTVDLNDLPNYANQPVPNYITKDNTPVGNAITDEGAALGRVLFYDKNLSVNNTISCASCHQQQFAFSDTAQLSVGRTGGVTGRHAMRLINTRFAEEVRFFWDERAASLEEQSTQPIRDHVEMGFSGGDGDPPLDSLFNKLEALDYYQTLFTHVYGDSEVTEERMQRALAQFIRSIQSFDSKFDEGLAQAPNINAPFPNFTAQENQGKALFLTPPPNGAGCQGCHQGPEFDIDRNSRNNGVIGVAGDPLGIDLTNTRAPSLRDLFNPDGVLNGPLMHTGEFTDISQVIDHYNLIIMDPVNTNLDPRLAGPPGPPDGIGQDLQLTQNEKDALIAFLQTLTGNDVYTNEKWSDPFDDQGNITILGGELTDLTMTPDFTTTLAPNPTSGWLLVSGDRLDGLKMEVRNLSGQPVSPIITLTGDTSINLSYLRSGVYLIRIWDEDLSQVVRKVYIQ